MEQERLTITRLSGKVNIKQMTEKFEMQKKIRNKINLFYIKYDTE